MRSIFALAAFLWSVAAAAQKRAEYLWERVEIRRGGSPDPLTMQVWHGAWWLRRALVPSRVMLRLAVECTNVLQNVFNKCCPPLLEPVSDGGGHVYCVIINACACGGATYGAQHGAHVTHVQ